LKQRDQLAVEMAYLEKGIIPRAPVFKDGDYLKAGLDSLDADNAIVAKRKFRKHLRRAIIWYERRIYHRAKTLGRRNPRRVRRKLAEDAVASFRHSIGLPISPGIQYTHKHRRLRRVLVENYIREHILPDDIS